MKVSTVRRRVVWDGPMTGMEALEFDFDANGVDVPVNLALVRGSECWGRPTYVLVRGKGFLAAAPGDVAGFLQAIIFGKPIHSLYVYTDLLENVVSLIGKPYSEKLVLCVTVDRKACGDSIPKSRLDNFHLRRQDWLVLPVSEAQDTGFIGALLGELEKDPNFSASVMVTASGPDSCKELMLALEKDSSVLDRPFPIKCYLNWVG